MNERKQKFNAYLFKKILKQRKITQGKFSDFTGYDRNTVNRWANGRTIPSEFAVQVISDALDIAVECFTEDVPLCTRKEYEEQTVK